MVKSLTTSVFSKIDEVSMPLSITVLKIPLGFFYRNGIFLKFVVNVNKQWMEEYLKIR